MSAPNRRLKILFLTKRQYMNKDVLGDRYGRFRELPLELARMGHEVNAIAFSYRARATGHFADVSADAEVNWTSMNLGRLVIPGIAGFWREINRHGAAFRPDVVLAASDAFHAIAGMRLAKRLGAMSAIDLYDNFESYTGTKLPGVFGAYKQALRDADLVTCISAPLEELVRETYGRTQTIIILENGIRSDLFRPMDKEAARSQLDLPHDKVLVGTAGAIERSRDIEVLFRAADKLAAHNSKIELVVAGPREPGLQWPTRAKVHDLGILKHADIPTFFNAIDVMVAMNKASDFGAFCHPQKIIEAVACGTPVIAPDLGAMASLLGRGSSTLFETGNPDSLVETVKARLVGGNAQQAEVSDWAALARRLSDAFINKTHYL